MFESSLKDIHFCVISLATREHRLENLLSMTITSTGSVITPKQDWLSYPDSALESERDALIAVFQQSHNHVLVSANAAYDFHVIAELCAHHGLTPPISAMIDPFYMGQSLVPKLANPRPESLVDHFSVKKGSSGKTGEPSIEAIASLTAKMLSAFQKKGKTTLGSILPYSRPKPVNRAYRPLYQILHDAFLRRRPVVLDYPKGNVDTRTQGPPPLESRKIDIYGFRTPFLVAYCHLRKDLRTFRLDRVQNVEFRGYERYEIPREFDLGTYFIGAKNLN